MDFSAYQITSLSIILLFSLILSIQDIKTLEADIHIQWASIYAALACHLIFARESMWIYILSSMIMGSFYFAIRKITKNKLGPADVWFGFFQGLFLTPYQIPVCLGVEVAATLIIINKNFGHKKFAFIPFMSFGLIITFAMTACSNL